MVWTSVVKALFSMPCGSLHGVCYSLKEQIGEGENLCQKNRKKKKLVHIDKSCSSLTVANE